MFQTLEGFLMAPFGEPEVRSNTFERSYQSVSKSKAGIFIEAITTIEDNYLLHIKVKSESSSRYYDVVLLFFTDDEKIKKDISFRNYYTKFFSNSPSFIYQYAVLYKEQGVLIDMLYDKMDQNYADVKPTKTNPTNKVSYDKSIYMACRFMLSHKISAFSKAGFFARVKKNPDKFFAGIRGFEDIKLETEIHQLDKRVDKELEKATSKDKEKPKNKFGGKTSKKRSVHSTMASGSFVITKKRKTAPMSKVRPRRQTKTKK